MISKKKTPSTISSRCKVSKLKWHHGEHLLTIEISTAVSKLVFFKVISRIIDLYNFSSNGNELELQKSLVYYHFNFLALLICAPSTCFRNQQNIHVFTCSAGLTVWFASLWRTSTSFFIQCHSEVISSSRTSSLLSENSNDWDLIIQFIHTIR